MESSSEDTADFYVFAPISSPRRRRGGACQALREMLLAVRAALPLITSAPRVRPAILASAMQK
jgi:hypothetical protein